MYGEGDSEESTEGILNEEETETEEGAEETGTEEETEETGTEEGDSEDTNSEDTQTDEDSKSSESESLVITHDGEDYEVKKEDVSNLLGQLNEHQEELKVSNSEKEAIQEELNSVNSRLELFKEKSSVGEFDKALFHLGLTAEEVESFKSNMWDSFEKISNSENPERAAEDQNRDLIDYSRKLELDKYKQLEANRIQQQENQKIENYKNTFNNGMDLAHKKLGLEASEYVTNNVISYLEQNDVELDSFNFEEAVDFFSKKEEESLMNRFSTKGKKVVSEEEYNKLLIASKREEAKRS